MKPSIIIIDFQKAFTRKGYYFRQRNSVQFLKRKVVPFLKKHNIKINEIKSDYRLPTKASSKGTCIPGEATYETDIPTEIIKKDIWIKAEHSPIWIKENAGNPKRKAGIPYQAPEQFTKWLTKNIGTPDVAEIFIIGLTLDCCVLSTSQELFWRGYTVHVIKEATDVFSGNEKEKERVCKNETFRGWMKPITWEEAKKRLK